MDIDNDGIDDVFSGSFPGDIYFFKGLGNNKYAKPILIKDREGKDICGKKSSSCFPFDFDKDGDYDLIISCGYGVGVGICKNIGSKEQPDFSRMQLLNLKKYTSVRENYNNSEAKLMPSHAVPSDWDDDGCWDLVCGDEHGNIVWYRNYGTNSKPEFREAEVLRDNPNFRRKEECPWGNGDRSKLFVYDYNNDGKKDVILGDFYMAKKVVRQISPKQERLKKRAEKEQAEWMSVFMDYLSAKNIESEKIAKESPEKSYDEIEKEANKRIPRKILKKYLKLKQKSRENNAILKKYNNEKNCYHGYVWVYIRK